MRDIKTIGRARNARLNQALKHAAAMSSLIAQVQGIPYNQLVDDADFWEELRDCSQSISQCIHEANAYNNTLIPEGQTGLSRTTYEVRGT